MADRLKKEKIDIATIQETKLRSGTATPRIQGYKSIRADRPGGVIGGGLLIYIRDSVVFQRELTLSTKGTEVMTIRVRLTKRQWIEVINVYIPPPNSTGQTIDFSVDHVPHSDRCIITGDFNAHSPLWDSRQPPDQRGAMLEVCTMSEELSVLNDGSHTRINKQTAGMSTPSLTLIGKMLQGKCRWSTGEQLSNSDYLPILTEVRAHVIHQPVLGRQA